MPNINDVKRGSELGYTNPFTSIRKFTYIECPKCNSKRWCQTPKANNGMCGKCAWAISGKKKRALTTEQKKVGKFIIYKDLCPVCNKELWRKYTELGRICVDCYRAKLRANCGDKANNWRGGRYIEKDGYVQIRLNPTSKYIPMARKMPRSYVIFEHRLVMAKHLGRCLESWEIVHHINGDKADNRIENLELMPNQSTHNAYTMMQKRIYELEQKVEALEKNNRLLEWQIKLIRQGNPELAEAEKTEDNNRFGQV